MFHNHYKDFKDELDLMPKECNQWNIYEEVLLHTK